MKTVQEIDESTLRPVKADEQGVWQASGALASVGAHPWALSSIVAALLADSRRDADSYVKLYNAGRGAE
jgi:hypothetical protein